MKVLNEENSKQIVKNVLSMREELTIKKGTGKADFTVLVNENPSQKYDIAVRYRNFPETETPSQVFDMTGFEAECEKNSRIPVLAFVFFDQATNRVYLSISTVKKMKEIAKEDSDTDIIKEVMHGIQIKYGRGHEALESYLNKFKDKIDFTIIERNSKTFY
ncbi:MAG: hypothetical protein KH275_01115 [Clostridiales bacterium]|nr:hypothetical protein [Clostridiales bacterium]